MSYWPFPCSLQASGWCSVGDPLSSPSSHHWCLQCPQCPGQKKGERPGSAELVQHNLLVALSVFPGLTCINVVHHIPSFGLVKFPAIRCMHCTLYIARNFSPISATCSLNILSHVFFCPVLMIALKIWQPSKMFQWNVGPAMYSSTCFWV